MGRRVKLDAPDGIRRQARQRDVRADMARRRWRQGEDASGCLGSRAPGFRPCVPSAAPTAFQRGLVSSLRRHWRRRLSAIRPPHGGDIQSRRSSGAETQGGRCSSIRRWSTSARCPASKQRSCQSSQDQADTQGPREQREKMGGRQPSRRTVPMLQLHRRLAKAHRVPLVRPTHRRVLPDERPQGRIERRRWSPSARCPRTVVVGVPAV